MEKLGRLDSVIAALGDWWRNMPLTELSMEGWQNYLNSNLTSHFIAAKPFLPVLAEGETSYTLLGGSFCATCH